MKEKILVGVIVGLVLILIGIGVYVAVTPTVNDGEGFVSAEQFPENELPSVLAIEKPVKRIPRLFAIRNYPDELIADEINKLPRVRFFSVDSKAQGHLLILPFETGGRIVVTRVVLDDYEDTYVASDKAEDVLIDETVTPGYGLLLQYDRPVTNPEIQIKIIEGSSTATYTVEAQGNRTDKKEFEAIQYISAD